MTKIIFIFKLIYLMSHLFEFDSVNTHTADGGQSKSDAGDNNITMSRQNEFIFINYFLIVL